ncbi:MAG TPA: methylated-DNA--[protein]-cysteine S-methyltransferase [Acidimicrobiales bacterium]|nr:methylated-DNA--[protein]-cysteine S-methyltransferase [Acidimicrobiales bacterium]
MPDTIWTTTSSPVGDLVLTGDGSSLAELRLPQSDGRPAVPANGHHRDDAAFAAVRAQLAEYFEGVRTTFDLPLAPSGTPFQLQVWGALCNIPYGVTASYGEVAASIGRPGAARAVGLANGRNPIAIIVPCHRVIGADGRLVGYGGGLDRKRYLLERERAARGTGARHDP